MRNLSAALIVFRALMALVLLRDAGDGSVSQWFLWCFSLGIVSDVLDGEILRRAHLSNTKLRSLDSITDAAFYMSVLVGMWRVHPSMLRAYSIPLAVLLTTQTASWLFCLARFGKTTSYHSYLAKFWGLTLFAGTINFFLFPSHPELFFSAICIGIASNLEDMVITAILPHWQCDVLHVKAAVRLRESEIPYDGS